MQSKGEKRGITLNVGYTLTEPPPHHQYADGVCIVRSLLDLYGERVAEPGGL